MTERRLRRVLDYIDSCLGEDLSLPQLAAQAGLSSVHFTGSSSGSLDSRPIGMCSDGVPSELRRSLGKGRRRSRHSRSRLAFRANHTSPPPSNVFTEPRRAPTEIGKRPPDKAPSDLFLIPFDLFLEDGPRGVRLFLAL
jgi:hypothetical protein